MPAGAPTKYKPEYCDGIIAHMAEGASATSYAAEIGVSRDTISEWTKVHPEFSVAFRIGKTKCAAWWERVARSNAVESNGSAPVIIFGLKNMSPDFNDTSEIDHKHSIARIKLVAGEGDDS